MSSCLWIFGWNFCDILTNFCRWLITTSGRIWVLTKKNKSFSLVFYFFSQTFSFKLHMTWYCLNLATELNTYFFVYVYRSRNLAVSVYTSVYKLFKFNHVECSEVDKQLNQQHKWNNECRYEYNYLIFVGNITYKFVYLPFIFIFMSTLCIEIHERMRNKTFSFIVNCWFMTAKPVVAFLFFIISHDRLIV